MNPQKIRVRFAPSPTGHLHIGNARTALFNWLFARHHGGTFILRIEDTDFERSTQASEKEILEDLRWLGITWDEGPDRGGNVGPYRQSGRVPLYQEYAQKLVASGKAYPCYCSSEELEAKREAYLSQGVMPKYDGKCRNLSVEEKQRLEQEGIKPSIRFRVESKKVVVNDFLRGMVPFESEVIGDFIILRSDGVASYNFAVVIDDALMDITHVIRGEDHLSNTPKQILVYQALGFPLPTFLHHALILGPDRTRLSKRHGAMSVSYYRQEGFLPEAMVNYLSLLGWSPEGEKEVLSVPEIIEQFSLERISCSAAVFDLNKLKWMNGIYIRRGELPRITDLALPFIDSAGYATKDKDRGWLEKVVDSVRGNMETLAQVGDYVGIFFEEEINLEPEAENVLKEESAPVVIKAFRDRLAGIDKIDLENYRTIVLGLRDEKGIKGQKLFMPLRVAVTGKVRGPELEKVLPILGKAITLERIDRVIERYNFSL